MKSGNPKCATITDPPAQDLPSIAEIIADYRGSATGSKPYRESAVVYDPAGRTERENGGGYGDLSEPDGLTRG
jgi:hypothetical protein